MRGDSLASATRFLVFALSGLYAVASLIVLLYAGFDATRTVFWLAFLLGGAALMLAGQLLARQGWASASLVSLGAILGGLPLVWTILVPVAAAAVVASSVALARAQRSVAA